MLSIGPDFSSLFFHFILRQTLDTQISTLVFSYILEITRHTCLREGEAKWISRAFSMFHPFTQSISTLFSIRLLVNQLHTFGAFAKKKHIYIHIYTHPCGKANFFAIAGNNTS